MKAAQFHACMRQHLEPAFDKAGFVVSGRGGRWTKRLGPQRSIVFELGLDRWGWSEPWGGKFAVGVRLDDAAAIPRQGAVLPDANDAHILEFLDVDGVRAFCRLRNAVIDKGLASTSTDPVAAMAMAIEREERELEKPDSPMPNMATWFPWLDADDLQAWGHWLVPVIDGLEKRLLALVDTDVRERRVSLRQCHLASDPRGEAQKLADRARRKLARTAAGAAMNAFAAALDAPRE
jgi:hypothetical protein